MTSNGVENNSVWSWEKNKAFEIALVIYLDGTVDRWEKIAVTVPGKVVAKVKIHYALLVKDVNGIEASLVEVASSVLTSRAYLASNLVEVPSGSSSTYTMKHGCNAKEIAMCACHLTEAHGVGLGVWS
ncbi:unnamed protein product [Ilex paraguariensis]|uniref:Uncharacterized protein n=1 Tax=Ilex paraguariensis TaxID=185542 RepID=A0ABC8R675_9AQUA